MLEIILDIFSILSTAIICTLFGITVSILGYIVYVAIEYFRGK